MHNTNIGLLTKINASCLQYQEEIDSLNQVARHRPRSSLVLGIQQENRQIRELQQENKGRQLICSVIINPSCNFWCGLLLITTTTERCYGVFWDVVSYNKPVFTLPAELRTSLEEHQSALELIMTKYREQVFRLLMASKRDDPAIVTQLKEQHTTVSEAW